METKQEPSSVQESKQPFRIEYGAHGTFFNVTLRALQKCFDPATFLLYLPASDVDRAALLGDPMFGVVKRVILHKDGLRREFDNSSEIKILLDRHDTFAEAALKWWNVCHMSQLVTGSFLHSRPILHLLSLLFLDQRSKIMQLGSSDAGCTTLVLSHVVHSPAKQLTVFETNEQHCTDTLMNLHANAASISSEMGIVLSQSPPASDADTIVAQGVDQFYLFFQQYGPMALRSIHTLVLAHEYSNPEHKDYIRGILQSLGFYRAYQHSQDTDTHFYEVWMRQTSVAPREYRPQRPTITADPNVVRIHQ